MRWSWVISAAGALGPFQNGAEVFQRRRHHLRVLGQFVPAPQRHGFLGVGAGQEGGGLAVSLSRGNAATLPVVNGAGRDLQPGRKVVLGLRPEHLSIHRGESDPQGGRIDALAEVVEPTGAETIVILKVGDQDVTGRFEPDHAPKLGETAPLAVNMAKACLFDPETEKLI